MDGYGFNATWEPTTNDDKSVLGRKNLLTCSYSKSEPETSFNKIIYEAAGTFLNAFYSTKNQMEA